MHRPEREIGISRRSWLLAGLAIPLFRARAADSLNARYDGDTIHVAPPSVHFLAGKTMERLKDGAAVAFVGQLDLLNEARIPVRQQRARFVVSYALWEEKYSVTQLGKVPRSVEGLSAAAAEAWCFEGLALSTFGIPPDQYFWLRFEMRTGGARDMEGDLPNGVSFKSIIDLLGRKKQVESSWGPLETRIRLADLPRISGRGTRG
jgi:hypothetical protein